MLPSTHNLRRLVTAMVARPWNPYEQVPIGSPIRKPSEIRMQLRIAGPLVLASLVNMGMSITDVIMMGWIGPLALAAGAIASDLYSIVFYLCAGVIAAVASIVSQARGAHQDHVIRRTTQQALWVALSLGLPGMWMISRSPSAAGSLGVMTEIVDGARAYAGMMAFTLLPMLGVTVWRQVLSAFADTRVIFRITLITLALNAIGNYAFMFGNFGAPALGLAGAGLSSALCATFMCCTLAAYVAVHPTLSRYRVFTGMFRPDWTGINELFRIGVPIGISNLGEMGIYLLSTAVIGTFGVETLAAHAVALRTAGVLYAFPLGLSQAAAVRVGLAAGARDEHARAHAVSTALGIAVIVGFFALSLIAYERRAIASIFVGNGEGAERIVDYAASLLLILATMEIFECLGTVAAGILRGIKDTRIPMLISMTAFWGVATTIGLGFGFGLHQRAFGVWIGLAGGAVSFSVLLLARVVRQLGAPRTCFGALFGRAFFRIRPPRPYIFPR